MESNLLTDEPGTTGEHNPHPANRAAAAVDLINVLFPDKYSAVKRNNPFRSNVFGTASDLSIQ